MRRPNVIRPVPLTTAFPEDIRAKLDLHCFSPAEGRVPKGAIQKFLIERIRDYFNGAVTIKPENKRLVAKVFEVAIEDTPQEWWVDNFANPQEAYLWATEFLKVLNQ